MATVANRLPKKGFVQKPFELKLAPKEDDGTDECCALLGTFALWCLNLLFWGIIINVQSPFTYILNIILTCIDTGICITALALYTDCKVFNILPCLFIFTIIMGPWLIIILTQVL